MRNAMHHALDPSDTACDGCGREDPCGYHYADCTLLEPGDVLVERETERIIGDYDGPDMTKEN